MGCEEHNSTQRAEHDQRPADDGSNHYRWSFEHAHLSFSGRRIFINRWVGVVASMVSAFSTNGITRPITSSSCLRSVWTSYINSASMRSGVAGSSLSSVDGSFSTIPPSGRSCLQLFFVIRGSRVICLFLPPIHLRLCYPLGGKCDSHFESLKRIRTGHLINDVHRNHSPDQRKYQNHNLTLCFLFNLCTHDPLTTRPTYKGMSLMIANP